MKRKNIVKAAGVLLLVTIMITSTISVVNAGNNTTPASDVETKEIWVGYTAEPQNTKAETWLHYDDGAYETMVGSNTPPLFMAIRLTPVELAAYVGSQFVKTSWYHVVSNASIPDHDYDAKIWIGNETRPITLLVNDTGLLASGQGWANHTLSTPVTINASNDYWIVIKCYAYPAVAYYDYPMPFDTNIASNISHKSKWWHNSLNHPETDFYEVATLNGAWLLRVAVEGGVEDTTPPVTHCNYSGNYSNGIYTGNVTVTITATDNESGVNYTRYQLDSGPWVNYTIPFIVTAEGFHSLMCSSVDRAGNVEKPHNCSFTIRHQPIVAILPWSIGFLSVDIIYSANFSDIPWQIFIEGKNLWIPKKNGSYEGNITDVGPDLPVAIQTGFLLGVGSFNLTVQVDVFPPIKAKGFILLFFMIVKPVAYS